MTEADLRKELARLNAVTTALSEALSPVDALDVVLEETRAGLGAAAGLIALVTGAEETLEVCCAVGFRDHPAEDSASAPQRAPPWAVPAVMTGQLVLLRSPEEMSALGLGRANEEASAGHHAWAAAPFVLSGRSLGVIALAFDAPQPFDHADRAFLLTVARQCAQALDRARVYEAERAARRAAERAAAQTARIQAVTAALSGALTPAEVSRVLLEDGLSALGASCGAIGLLTEDGQAIEVMRSSGYSDGYLARAAMVPLEASLPIAEAVRAGAPVWLTRAADWGALAAHPVRGAWAAIPLIVNGRVIGGLDFSFAEARELDEEERDFAVTLASQATLALERACLFDAERRARQQIAFLADANALFSSGFDSDDALKRLSSFVVPFFAEACAVDRLDREGLLRRVGAARETRGSVDVSSEALGKAAPDRLKQGAIARAMETGRSEILVDISGAVTAELWRDDDPSPPSLVVRSAMFVPLVEGGRVLGVLSFGSYARRFGAAELAVAESLARRAAAAIDRARLYREAEEARRVAERATVWISQLQAITAAASEALTPRQVAEAVIRQAIEPIGACAGGFAQLLEDGTSIELMGLTGYTPDEVDPARPIPLKVRAPLPEAIREGKRIFLESPEDVLARYPALAAMHAAKGHGAIAVIPLLIEGRALGALGLVFPGPRVFSDDDRLFLATLGEHCAQALGRARAYEAERKAHVAADEANRMKDEFLATLSHELRTPLTAILGWARMLRTMKRSESTAMRALETIERNASLQSRLIDDLLDASRIITGKLRLDIQSTDLASVIQAAVDAVSHAANAKEITLLPVIDPSLGTIDGDPSRLQQIVWNLLSNAIKFTPKGGTVEIRLDRAGAEARIRVTDTGQGIPREFLPFVFDRFRQADSAMTRLHGGLGLGLAIVRALVDVHGGAVTAESAGKDRGATFTVRLPLPQGRRAVSRAPLTNESPFLGLPDLAGVRVIVVDDEPDSLDVLAAVLTSQGADVSTASSARQALSLIESRSPDILVSDIAMPEEDGYDLIRKVRLLDPDNGGRVAAVALTAYARVEDRVRALSAGYQMHVAKPVSPAELVTVVASLCAGARSRSAGSEGAP